MNRTRIFRICFFLPLVILSAGCAAVRPAPTATPTPSPTPAFPLPQGAIIFEIEPARKFAGHVTGQGETAIILANMSTGGESQWDPFVSALDKDKFTIITFNYLQPDYSGAPQGVLTILGRLREVGYKRVVCMGASLGVSACGAISQEPEMVGMVMIAGPNLGLPVSTTYPKLFIAAADDPTSKDINYAFKAADEPKQLVLYPDTGMHGTGLFYSQYREQIIKALVDFVNNLP
jgi:hypothetical protein